MTAENSRLEEARIGKVAWRKWGPYLSERQWGTVREDYSDSGDAWNYFSHDQARSRAYRWGEDGLAGISDDSSNSASRSRSGTARIRSSRSDCSGSRTAKGNHGEDVKEYYFYLDSTPTHSYMKYLYKYPQRGLSVRRASSRQQATRSRHGHGVRAARHRRVRRQSLLRRVRGVRKGLARRHPRRRSRSSNRGPEAATLHVLPTVWFRNTWSWAGDAAERPRCSNRGRRDEARSSPRRIRISASAYRLQRRRRRVAVHRERNEHRALFGTAEPDALRQGRDQRTRRARRRGRREPEQDAARRPRRTTSSRRSRASRRRCACGSRDAAPSGERRDRGRSPTSTTCSRRGAGGGRVLRDGDSRIARRRPGARDAAGARRHAVVEAVLLLRRRQVARASAAPIRSSRTHQAPRNEHWHHM